MLLGCGILENILHRFINVRESEILVAIGWDEPQQLLL